MYIFIDANIYLGSLFETEPFHSECQEFIDHSSQSNIDFVITPEILDSVKYRIKEKHRWLIRTIRNVYHELKDQLIALDDQHIVLKTEKLRKKISKEEYKEKHEKIEKEKQKIEDKIAFLKVEIIDYEFD